MIRHTIIARGDPELQQATLSCCIQGLQDGDCVKLTQNNQKIYLSYRLS